MSIQLPTSISNYLAADAESDIDRVIASFTPSATVIDEGETIKGREAIAAWKRAVSDKYEYTVTPLSFSQTGNSGAMGARLEGNFPGSPVDVVYSFEFDGDLIASMKVE